MMVFPELRHWQLLACYLAGHASICEQYGSGRQGSLDHLEIGILQLVLVLSTYSCINFLVLVDWCFTELMSLLKLNVVCSLKGIKLRVQRIDEQKDLIERWLSRLESHPKPIPECNIMRTFLEKSISVSNGNRPQSLAKRMKFRKTPGTKSWNT